MSKEELYYSDVINDGSLYVTGWATIQLLS